MRYAFKLKEPHYFEGDDGEGSRRAGMSTRETTEHFEADSDSEALSKAVEIMQKKKMQEGGKDYLPEAIFLHRILDISMLYRG